MSAETSWPPTSWWREPPEDFGAGRIAEDALGRKRWALANGYALVHDPLHDLASPRHGTILEHRMVVYDAGIDPDGMDVHHVNHDRQDNRLANLAVVERSSHRRQHAVKRWADERARKPHGNRADA